MYLTGEPAEEVVEGLPGVSPEALDVHEAWRWCAVVAGVVTGGGASAALLVGEARERSDRRAVLLTLGCDLLSTGLLGYRTNV